MPLTHINNPSVTSEIPSVSSELIVAERDILTRVALGGVLSDVLRDIILMVEKPSNGEMLASILLVSESGRTLVDGVAPSLPSAYNAAIDGIPVAHGVGSCGTAAFSGNPVIVSDIATDPLWKDYKDLAVGYGLRACWSMPILAADGRVLGTFANYYHEPKEPTERDLEVISMVTRTTAIAIERHKNELARARAEEARLLLLRELNHRVKNLFALVDSLLHMSARSASSVEEFSKAVRGRLQSLNRAHELIQPGLSGSEIAEASEVPLVKVLGEIVKPYAGYGAGTIDIAGPEVMVSSNAITGIALVFHELATNAAKYGALRHDGGRLSVSWTLADTLKVCWEERGSSRGVLAPTRSGFGSKLVQRMVEGQLKGTISYDWRPYGLKVSLSVPLAELVGSHSATSTTSPQAA